MKMSLLHSTWLSPPHTPPSSHSQPYTRQRWHNMRRLINIFHIFSCSQQFYRIQRHFTSPALTCHRLLMCETLRIYHAVTTSERKSSTQWSGTKMRKNFIGEFGAPGYDCAASALWIQNTEGRLSSFYFYDYDAIRKKTELLQTPDEYFISFSP